MRQVHHALDCLSELGSVAVRIRSIYLRDNASHFLRLFAILRPTKHEHISTGNRHHRHGAGRPDSLAQAQKSLNVELGFADYQSVLERSDVHGVVIATPTAFHREIAVAAARAGKHVLCEKPMAMNVAECDAIIAAAGSAGIVLQIGFMRRYSESFVQAKARIDAGEIGAVVQVKTLTHGPSYPRPWMFDLKKSNGPLAEVCSHDIDTQCKTGIHHVLTLGPEGSTRALPRVAAI